MKTKKIITTLCLFPLLVSCGKNSISGTYAFQMGKEKGTHFGLYLDLFDDAYTEHEEVVNCKKMNFSFNASFPTGSGEETQEEIGSVLDTLKDENGNYVLDGYYKLEDVRNKLGEQKLTLGFSFLYIVNTIEDLYKDAMGEDLPENAKQTLELLNNLDFIESIVYATYVKGEVNLYIPVSMDDVYYQLYWYGYDVRIREEDYSVELVNVTKHDFGSVPTEDDVASINQTFAQDHEGLKYTSYRAFNDLKLTLILK